MPIDLLPTAAGFRMTGWCRVRRALSRLLLCDHAQVFGNSPVDSGQRTIRSVPSTQRTGPLMRHQARLWSADQARAAQPVVSGWRLAVPGRHGLLVIAPG